MKTWLPALLTCLAALLTADLRAQVIAGPITNANTGNLYYLLGPAHWADAQAQAKSLGGYLVAINDAAENAWVLATFGDDGGVGRALMIGLTDEAHEGQWRWVSGEPVTYLNWAGGEPNNGQGFFPYENVAAMYGADDARAGLWNDIMGTLEEQRCWGVVEVPPVAELTLRVSEVELSWFGLNGQSYQPQYRSSLTTNLWVNLSDPLPVAGSVIVFRDQVAIGLPSAITGSSTGHELGTGGIQRTGPPVDGAAAELPRATGASAGWLGGA